MTSTSTRQDQLHVLRLALEEQFTHHTDELTRLTVASTTPEQYGFDPQTLNSLIATSRQAIADTTQALRRMADGNYGRCDRCEGDIPVERLEIRPQARFCVPCQQAQAA